MTDTEWIKATTSSPAPRRPRPDLYAILIDDTGARGWRLESAFLVNDYCTALALQQKYPGSIIVTIPGERQAAARQRINSVTNEIDRDIKRRLEVQKTQEKKKRSFWGLSFGSI